MKLTCTTALQSTYHCRMNKCYLHGCLVNCSISIRLPVAQVFIYPAAVYNKPYSSGRRANSLGLFKSFDAGNPKSLKEQKKKKKKKKDGQVLARLAAKYYRHRGKCYTHRARQRENATRIRTGIRENRRDIGTCILINSTGIGVGIGELR